MQNCEKNEELVAEIERQQREYRGRLKMLEPGSAEWELMQVRIEGNETIKKTLMGTKTKIKMKLIEKLKRLLNQKVLLCDLDGTLIETKSGEPFPQDYDDWQFKKHIKEAILEYNPKYIFIISNQGGIEAGYVDDRKFRAKLKAIMDEMRTWGNYIVDGVYCRSNNPNNLWRKPNVGMIDFFRYDYADGYDFCNRQALMIGDASGLEDQFSDSDLHCAQLAGIKYADVSDFIKAMVPCLAVCGDNDLPCGSGEDYPFLPCSGTSRSRLKSNLLYNPFVLRMR